MGILVHVALVPRGVTVDMSDVTQVAAALSIQIARDVSPIWSVNATVSAFAKTTDVPVGYWPIYIEDPSKMPAGAGGVHLDKRNQPYALIETGDQWSLDASHELIEMLVDPSGNKMQANPLLDQAIALGQAPQQVQYIVEACDPTEDASYAYQINGVLVSDFFTPNFYDAGAAPGVRYDFTGALTGPRQVLTNGYISWLDPTTDALMQLQNFIGQDGKLHPQVINLSQNAAFRDILANEAYRPAIDRETHAPKLQAGIDKQQRASIEAHQAAVKAAAHGRALMFKKDVG